MKKKLKAVCVGIGVLLAFAVVGLIILYLSLGRIVKTGVQTVGSRVTGSSITVDSVDVALLRGRVNIRGLVVGNPEGFKTSSAFELGEVAVRMTPASFFSDTIIIEDVLVDEPQFTYEIGVGKTNIGKILDNVEAFTGPKEDKPAAPEPEKEKTEGKKVRIDHLLVQNGKVRISATVMQGTAVPIPLPKVEMTDIGADQGDEEVSAAETVAIVLREVLGSVVDVVKQSGQLKDLGLEALDSAISSGKDALEQGTGTLRNAGEKAKKGFSGLLNSVKGTDKTE